MDPKSERVPLKVLLVDESAEPPSPLRAALRTAGWARLVATLEAPFDVVTSVAEHAPYVLVVDTPSPSAELLGQLALLASRNPRPIVFFTGDRTEDAIRGAIRAGASAYVVDGFTPDRLEPILRVAIERFEVEHRLRADLRDAKSRLDERKLVERAKGLLMKRRGLDEEEAFVALRTLAMQRGVRLGEAARHVINAAALLR